MLPVLFNIFITLLFYILLKYVLNSNNRDEKQNKTTKKTDGLEHFAFGLLICRLGMNEF